MKSDVEAFLNRDWALARVSQDRFIAERIARLGAAEALRCQDLLRAHVEGQSITTREEDLAAHIALSEKPRRASQAQGGV